MSLHFPSVQEANDFRRNLIAGGRAHRDPRGRRGRWGGDRDSGLGHRRQRRHRDLDPIHPQRGSVRPGEHGWHSGSDPAGWQPGPGRSGQHGRHARRPRQASLGQADPANMGGTARSRRRAPAWARPIRPTWAARSAASGGRQPGPGRSGQHGRHLAPGAASLGQADPANMGGTPQSEHQRRGGRHPPLRPRSRRSDWTPLLVGGGFP